MARPSGYQRLFSRPHDGKYAVLYHFKKKSELINNSFESYFQVSKTSVVPALTRLYAPCLW